MIVMNIEPTMLGSSLPSKSKGKSTYFIIKKLALKSQIDATIALTINLTVQ